MLKKQTVWLLTMLSLMIVLSVYYMTSPGSDQLSMIGYSETDVDETTSDMEDGNIDPVEAGEADEVSEAADGSVISQISSDQLFDSIRLQIQDERSAIKTQLEEVVASSSTTSEEKNQARSEMKQLEKVSTKESILEESILAEANYQDVLVRKDDDVVHVTVRADEELSKTEANNIMRSVMDEFGQISVDVKYQPIS
ncbi:SpoIIIAH-like family protein [Aquibacillus sp. 3ASR75-11]|uniref:SpoIIIAH-like family protein n=1 Tax=Terrihalobacillus insolitus TaxID=2950438 RepID=A0A9X3WXR3_9BACI|nr:SpoIIIAH-like family protein [Terrihalobacillus insolitus]MDC3414429.1 SpoIIIAH-like family protein [Terrihalobacillus insolitus]MDC3425309.1 SpoIIIAH-like family protein [Terrihalobacillus insolitus]